MHHYAQHLVETRRFEAAVEIYRKALTISPDDFEVTFNLANCYRQLRHHKDAEKFYRRAVEIKPEVSESTSFLLPPYFLRCNLKSLQERVFVRR